MIGPAPDITGNITETAECASSSSNRSTINNAQDYGGAYNPTANLGLNSTLPSAPAPSAGVPTDKTG